MILVQNYPIFADTRKFFLHISIDLLLYCRSGIDALSVMQVLRGDASSFLVI